MTDRPMSGRLALVTGASRGIGRAVALGLAAAGAHVIAAARRRSALEDLDDRIREIGGTATLLQIDLRSGDKVDAIGPTLYQRWGKLDMLVANAGILGPLSPLNHLSREDWDQVMQINVTANWHLIRSLDPLLRASDAGRAVFVTSGASAAKRAYWGPYSVSKAALEALAKTYAHEVASSNVRVNLLNPGPIRTEMRARAFPGENPATLPPPEDLVPLFMKLLSPECDLNGERLSYPQDL